MNRKYIFILGLILFCSLGGAVAKAQNKESLYTSCSLGETTFNLKYSNKKLRLLRLDPHKNLLLHARLDTIIYSTGNPFENISMQFVTEELGFIYGNEMGYGYWPFVFRTTDGGLTWKRQLFKDYEYGAPIYKEHFHMFDNNYGILIHNTTPVDRILLNMKGLYFRYYITNNGGKTWQKKKVKIAPKVIYRVENNPAFLHCTYKANGKITVRILRPNWEAVSGKRSIEDRTIMTLISTDFGENFEQTKNK